MKKFIAGAVAIAILIAVASYLAGQKWQRNYDIHNIEIVDVTDSTVTIKWPNGETDNGKTLDSDIEMYSYISD